MERLGGPAFGGGRRLPSPSPGCSKVHHDIIQCFGKSQQANQRHAGPPGSETGLGLACGPRRARRGSLPSCALALWGPQPAPVWSPILCRPVCPHHHHRGKRQVIHLLRTVPKQREDARERCGVSPEKEQAGLRARTTASRSLNALHRGSPRAPPAINHLEPWPPGRALPTPVHAGRARGLLARDPSGRCRLGAQLHPA